MTLKEARRHATRERPAAEHWTPDEAMQFDALVSACALVAHADGWVTPEERQSAIDRMRRLETVSVFGVEEALEAFEALVASFGRDSDDAVKRAEAAVLRLKGRLGPSLLLIEAACAIAAADRGFDHEERETILRLCELLDVEPDVFKLVPT